MEVKIHTSADVLMRVVFIQTALQYFFDNAVIPIYFGNTPISLMEYLPLFRQGYVMEETPDLLMSIYTSMNNLTDLTPGVPVDADITELLSITPDNLTNNAFNDIIPAYYENYGYDDEVLMQEAVESGRIPNYLNTFQVVQNYNATFNPAIFQEIFYLDIIQANSQRLLPANLKSYFDSQEFIDAVLDEYLIVLDMYRILMEMIQPELRITGVLRKIDRITDTMIMDYAMAEDPWHQNILNKIVADPRSNKLIYAIHMHNLDDVKRYINMYDPRDNNLEAYHLAVAIEEPEIIDVIRKAIIERNALEQKTFQTMMQPFGEFDVPETEMFRQYGRSLLNK